MVSSSIIKSLVQDAGFDLCGVIRTRCYIDDEQSRLNEWISSGRADGVEYMSRYEDLRLDSRKIVEGGRSVIVCGLNYHRDNNVDIQRPRIAKYAQMRDYHKTIRKALKGVMTSLKLEYPDLSGRIFTDSAPLLEKRMACDAGFGWIGRQSLLINPIYGSYILLGEIVIDAEVDSYDTPNNSVGCGECRRCIESCPVGAIGEGCSAKTIDTRLCISAQTIESDGVEGVDSRGWIFGCDLCTECCPHNHNTPISANPITERVITPPTHDEWLAMSSDEFNTTFAGTPLKRSSLERVLKFLHK